ncbi:GNAT family acetyltransferase [Parasphingorhabdus halotolerans]|uniref:GNAT family acetyltransferase n=1 Tax=Parasphingorhabdus halotolerans TaxID=2725558 RepID=A0A6H2DKZ4_9SPHN|nr:GNAT family acetyltransferase [Parasphingorhabdus halotolerans]QJB69342.1 GNAT family acetyltransferase [Parasphingorhabdus halotolerans]
MSELGHDILVATPKDSDAIILLWEACGLTRPWNDASADFRLAVAGAKSDILILKQGGQIAAAVMVGFDGHRGWAYYLAVDPDNRLAGLGRKMMKAAEQWLEQHSAPKIQLMVREDNEQAIGFYKALGYEVQPVVTIGRRLDQGLGAG